MESLGVVGYVLTALFGVLWYLLKQKDAMQEQQIAALFDKHDIDAAELVKLKYDIAKEHYVKGELDLRFDKLEASFTKGFDSLGDKFDKLADTLVDHMRKEDARHDRE